MFVEPVVNSLGPVTWGIVILEYEWVARIAKHIPYGWDEAGLQDVDLLAMIHVSVHDGKFSKAMDTHTAPYHNRDAPSGPK